MNIQLAKKKLEKINRLIDTFEPGDSHVSRLERDLIMSYTREFYEAIAEPTNGAVKPQRTQVQSSSAPTTPVSKIRVQPESQPKQEIKEEVIIQQYSEQERKAEKVISDKISEEAVAVEAVIEKTSPNPSPQSATKKSEKTPKESVAESVPKIEEVNTEKIVDATAVKVAKSTTNPELLELFSIKKANEISEKLSQLPISDLNKAMGVNEKIFVKNELFGGDDNVFRSTLSRLNAFQNFDEAKNFLASEVAGSFEWTAPDKSKKAKNFIQLVYRRYK
ncbi:MAG: hypothetical protein EA362_09590 [Saprospirales bacterium]|nr:MAG: hypothetical protein EA362_09590 [Saprospirales bacterium]